MKELDPLFSPVRIGTMDLKNRLVQSPMHTRYATGSGEVSEQLIAYMTARARGGAGLIIVENTAVDWELGRAAGAPIRLDDDRFVTGLHDLVEAVHRAGAKIATELHHAGRQNTRGNITGGAQPIAPSPIACKVSIDEPRAMTIDEIHQLVEQFGEAARRTVQAGCDAVEIHGSHGYLLTQFFSPYTNHRADEYGGSLENRARVLREITRRVRQAVGPTFPIIYRLNAEDRVPGGTTLEDTLHLVQWLEEDGVDAFDVTAGIYESMEWIFTMAGVEPGSLADLAAAVKDVVSVPVIAISRLGFDLHASAALVRDGKTDLIAMGRTQLADPQLVNKAHAGRWSEIRRCIACNECVAGFLFNGWRVQCVINPELGNEFRHLVQPALQPKHVLVCGGGPAGMEAARVAAQRGHHVTLMEQRGCLGGQLLSAAKPGFKSKEMSALIAFYEDALTRAGVTVQLNSPATAEAIAATGADVVLLALGTVVAPPTWAGNGRPAYLTATDVLEAEGQGMGETVAIVGGQEIGLNAAIYLAETGHNVTLIEQGPDIALDINALMRAHMLTMAGTLGVDILTNCTVKGAEDGAHGTELLLGFGSEHASRRFANVVSALGPVAPVVDGLTTALSAGTEVREIGTYREPGRLYRATQDGFFAAVEI